ncbi:hypothetical protein H0H87_004282, partial [Tephrocybe sp. NHM501043]
RQHHRADQAPQLGVLVCPPLPRPLCDIERERAQGDGRALKVVDNAAVEPGTQEREREADGAGRGLRCGWGVEELRGRCVAEFAAAPFLVAWAPAQPEEA